MAVMGSKNILAIIFCFSATILLLRTVGLLWNTYLSDFSIFHQALFVGFTRQNPYVYKDFFAPFIYPPIFLSLLYPLYFFSFQTASHIWLILSIVFFLLSIIMLSKILHSSFFLWSVVFLLSVLAFPFKFTLGMGQVNVLLLFTIVGFVYFYNRSKSLASFLLVVAVIIKIIPILFLYPIFLKKDYRTLFDIVLLLLFAAVVSFWIFGYEDNIYYGFHIFPSVIAGVINESYFNNSLIGTFARFHIAKIGILFQILIAMATFFLLWIKRLSLIASVSMLLTMTLLISSFAWQHHLLVLLIPFYYLLQTIKDKKQYVILFLSYFLIAMNIKTPAVFEKVWYGNIVLSHATFGILILYILLFISLSKTKKYE
jgi:hypothetical protein